MDLKNIYQPIKKDLKIVDDLLREAFKRTKNRSILKLTDYLLGSPGKRIRPALVVLSAKAVSCHKSRDIEAAIIKIAAAVELIHLASLTHDDVVDHASLRHNKQSVNRKWGDDVSIALGDYLYSEGFELISSCGNADILSCISQATKAMCEGELIQICQRDNFSLSKRRYFIIVKKKTASLFAASCQAGAKTANSSAFLEGALKNYGLNFGIAFQIIDDYLDLVSEKERLGKAPGQDIAVGEMTLPLLNLLESTKVNKRPTLLRLIKSKDKRSLKEIKKRLLHFDAVCGMKKSTLFYVNAAKATLNILPDSVYRDALIRLADFLLRKGFPL